MSFKEWILPVGLVVLSFLMFYISWALSDPKLNNIPDPVKVNSVGQHRNGFVVEQKHRLESVITGEYRISTYISYYRNDSLLTLEYWVNKTTTQDSLRYYLNFERHKAEKELIKLENLFKSKRK